MNGDEAPLGLAPGLVPLHDEAVAVSTISPPAAAALLRLLLRAVVTGMGRPGRDLRRDLEELGSGRPGVMRALDAIGMSADHGRRPGEIDLTQGHTDVQNLRVLLHVLVEDPDR